MKSVMLPVEKNVPLPPKGGGIKRYPWGKLTPVEGDPPRGPSFFVERPDEEIEQAWNSLTSAARYFSKRTGRSFTMRRVDGGIRVWRTL